MNSDTKGQGGLVERLRDMAEAARAVANKQELENGLAEDLVVLEEAASELERYREALLTEASKALDLQTFRAFEGIMDAALDPKRPEGEPHA